MSKTIFSILFTVLIVLVHNRISAQEKAFPVNLSLFNESTALPFTRFFTTPVHPGIQAGTEFDYNNKAHSRLFQTANISYFYHNYLAQGIGFSTELGYEYRLRSGVAFTGLIGIGYLHTFASTDEFKFSGGRYEMKPDKGNARLFPSLSFEAGYYLKKAEKHSPELFIRYQSWAEYPYSPGFIPVMTHISLHIGAKFFITFNTGHDE
jgi:hypothetical protein